MKKVARGDLIRQSIDELVRRMALSINSLDDERRKCISRDRMEMDIPEQIECTHVVTNTCVTTITSLGDGRHLYLNNFEEVVLVRRQAGDQEARHEYYSSND